MSTSVQATMLVAAYFLQRLAIAVIATAAIAMALYSLAAAAGLAPWLILPLQFGNTLLPDAGIVVQLGVTLLAVSLLFYLPAHGRMMALEQSHRSFHMSMRDVARAYAAAHKADREGVFTLSSEFDSVRDRIAFLRAHPDLDTLEAGILELAAQMSHISHELARTYSDANVARARDFLVQRQEDIAEFDARVREAKAITEDMARWRRRIDLEEEVAQSQLDQLRAELAEILPELVMAPEASPADRTDAAKTPQPDLNDEPALYADDDRIVALLARRAAP